MVIKNFASYKDATIHFSKTGLHYIKGINGAGKTSAFVDAPDWILFGETLKKHDYKDDIISSLVGKNTEGSLIVYKGKREYKIARYRKHHQHQNALYLKYRKHGKWVNRTGATNPDTQKKINALLGLDFNAFNNSIIFGQGNLTRFPVATDAEKKKIFEEILQMHWIPAAYNSAKQKCDEINNKIVVTSQRINDLDKYIADKKVDYRQLRNIQQQQQFDSMPVAIKAMKHIIACEERLDELEAALIPFNPEADLKKLKVQQQVLQKEWNARKYDTQQLHWKYKSTERIKSDWEHLQNDLKVVRQSISSTKKKRPSCKSCKQKLRGFALTKYVYILCSERDALSVKCSLYKKHYNLVCKADVQAADAFRIINKKLEKLNEEIVQVEQNIKNRQYAFDEVIEVYTSMMSAMTSLGSSDRYSTKMITTIADMKNSIRKKRSKLKLLNVKMTKLRKRLNYYEFWKHAYSNKGMKATLISSVIPFLNKRAVYYTGILTDGTIKVNFGLDDNQIVVRCYKIKGAKKRKGLSGGEQKRADIIQALTLRDLVTSRGQNAIGLLVLDEVFDALDDIGVEKAIELIFELERLHGAVYVISHNKILHEHFINNNIIHIKNRNGISRIIT
jgi:DNA repair exonuclease SbcCD ATPase subunit